MNSPRVVRERHVAPGRAAARAEAPAPSRLWAASSSLGEPRLPRGDAGLRLGRGREMADDGLAGRDVAPLVLDAARENPARGRLVDRIGALAVLHVDGEEMRLEHAVDSGEPLDGLARRLGRLDGVHEGDEGVIGRLGFLGVRAQLGQPPAPGIGVLGIVPDVAAEQELGRELGGERDPAGHDAGHALARRTGSCGRGGRSRPPRTVLRGSAWESERPGDQ